MDGRKFTQKEITVYIGFCDQSPSEGSGLLNPKEVAKSSGFQVNITTRRLQNTGLVVARPLFIGCSDQYRSLFTTEEAKFKVAIYEVRQGVWVAKARLAA